MALSIATAKRQGMPRDRRWLLALAFLAGVGVDLDYEVLGTGNAC